MITLSLQKKKKNYSHNLDPWTLIIGIILYYDINMYDRNTIKLKQFFLLSTTVFVKCSLSHCMQFV